MSHHVNNGNCLKCLEILNRYPGFHEGLKQWFIELQKKNSECHCSAGGRGKKDQELYFKQGSSKAHYGQSAHNANLAIDIFKLSLTNQAEWPKDWFGTVILSAVDSHNHATNKTFEINWYGKKGSAFFELPHCEVKSWKELVAAGTFKLVEPL